MTANALVAPAIALAIATGLVLLRKALGRQRVLPEEVALAAAWVFVVGGLVWLRAFLGDSTLLGFGAPWTWLAASHFAAAGFGALTITALTCRAVSDARALRILRMLLVAHPVAYLVTAAGISGVRHCNELAAVSYELIFATQLVAFMFCGADRMARGPGYMLVVALAVPVVTLVFALAWAFGRPLFDLGGMVRYHGLVNAMGHVGLGLAAFAWGRPHAHSPARAASLS